MEKILETYMRRLTNLSGNNRSLLLLRLVSDQCLDLHEFDYVLNQPSFKIIEGLIGKKDYIPLCAEADARDGQANTLSQRLKKLQRIDEFIFQERGARDLYIGWPFVRGKFSDGTPVRCPLIFFPVSLVCEKGQWQIIQRKGVNVTFNKSFLLGYAFYNGVSLDEELVEFVLTDMDKDSTIFRTALYEVLKNSKLEVHFNQENFMDKLHPFASYKKAELEAQEAPGELKLYPEAVLGIFPQAGSYLVPDYVKLLREKTVTDIAEFFTQRVKSEPESATNLRYSDQVKEETTFTPFELDASQEQALKLVKKGNSLVVQGPPGTGKSQLICNLISDFIARGKNVLLVCQKRAALDVVFERLRKQELHDFIGLVHDFKNDRKEIFDQIARQIESVDDYRQKNNSLDAIHLERTFLQSSRRIDQITEELEEFKQALFDERECGKSVKELYLSSSPESPSIPLNQQYRSFHYQEVPAFLSRLAQYLAYRERLEVPAHFWLNGPSYADFGVQDLLRLREVADEITEFQQQLIRESKAFATASIDFESARHFLTHLGQLDKLIDNLNHDTTFLYYRQLHEHAPEGHSLNLAEMEKTLMQCFRGSGPEISLASAELGRFQESLERAIKARRGPISWLRWQLFSKDKIFITRVLVANQLKSNKEGFEVLLHRIDNRLNYEHVATQIQEAPWLVDFPTNFRKIDLQNWFFYQKLAVKCLEITGEIRALDKFVPLQADDTRESYLQRLRQLRQLVALLPVQLQLWGRYMSEAQIRALLLRPSEREAHLRQLNQDFDAIVEYHRLQEGFTSDQKKMIGTLLDEPHDTTEDVVMLFQNSLALAWINHIETKYPILRGVSSFKLDHLTQELRQAIDDKMATSREILLLKSRERTYANLEYNRLNNVITYRELHHQVTKKRQIWPIRRVMAHYSEEVFALLPCWMTSPESASALFPMEEIFDLVIFDEASQCFAERGIPAMYRGKQVVIAGDDKQLQPNDLYRVRWEEEAEEAILEVDSLLSLARHFLKEVSLKGHYRSQSLELMEFSNRHFYQGKLKLLPDFHVVNREQRAIRYMKVNGTWMRNINMAEAMEVVELVQKLLKEAPEKSIGIVTFNVPQQVFIQDMLENKLTRLPKGIFVKNIENVQGDERDIIIFSTAYGPDEQGKIQLRFGSLNLPGGENRLNVAITRAREAVYVITSLLPGQLDVAETTNAGPKMLRDYLEYAWKVSEGEWYPDPLEVRSRPATWYLRGQLSELVEEPRPQKEMPFADLTIKARDTYKGVVLTDDELFFESLSAKESHSYLPNHLLTKNWPFARFYSREFWLSRAHTREKLQKFLERIVD